MGDDGEPKGKIETEAYTAPGLGSMARYTIPVYEDGIRWGYLIVTEDFVTGETSARMNNDIRLLG